MALRTELIEFLDSIRDYVRESHANLAYDERESSEFVDVYLNKRSAETFHTTEHIKCAVCGGEEFYQSDEEE